MNQTEQIKQHLLEAINSKEQKLNRASLDALFECGAMQNHTALTYVVKSDYFIMKRGSDISTRSAIIDLSIKWGICETKVANIIYKTPHIKI